MDDEPIYKFDGLKRLLTSRGYKIGEAKAWTPIKGKDVNIEAFRNGQITFSPSGGVVYVDDDGYKHFGFLYKRRYNLAVWPEGPKMHTTKCKTLDEFIARGSFDVEYRFAETSTVLVLDMSRGNAEVEMTNLQHCGNCRNKRLSKIAAVNDSKDFSDLVSKSKEFEQYRNSIPKEEKETGIFGYTRNWEAKSREIRERRGYKCELCGIEIKDTFDRQYMHVHHKNGKKEDNRDSNLQCLCIRCHANVDEHHRARFSFGAKKVELEEFIERYVTIHRQMDLPF